MSMHFVLTHMKFKVPILYLSEFNLVWHIKNQYVMVLSYTYIFTSYIVLADGTLCGENSKWIVVVHSPHYTHTVLTAPATLPSCPCSHEGLIIFIIRCVVVYPLYLYNEYMLVSLESLVDKLLSTLVMGILVQIFHHFLIIQSKLK